VYCALHVHLKTISTPGFTQPAETQKNDHGRVRSWISQHGQLTAHSRYSGLSQSQQLYHVSPEPPIYHQEQEDTSEDEDEERESSIKGGTHKNHASTATELVVALEALPAKAILPPKPKDPSQKLLKGKVPISKAGKTNQGSVNRRQVGQKPMHESQTSRTTSTCLAKLTLHTMALTSIDHQYTQLKLEHSALVTAT
jgi:hypothetical protein